MKDSFKEMIECVQYFWSLVLMTAITLLAFITSPIWIIPRALYCWWRDR